MVSNTHEILMLEADESDSAPVPKSKANRVLKEISSSTIPSWQTPRWHPILRQEKGPMPFISDKDHDHKIQPSSLKTVLLHESMI